MKTGNRLPSSIHISRQIAGLCIGVVGGIALSALLDLDFAATSLWLVATVVLILLSLSRRSSTFLMLTVFAGLTLGMWRGTNEQLALRKYQQYFGASAIVVGTINEDT